MKGEGTIECKQNGGRIATSYTFGLGSVSLAMSDRHFNLTDRFFWMLWGLSLYHSRMETVSREAGGCVQREKGRVCQISSQSQFVKA